MYNVREDPSRAFWEETCKKQEDRMWNLKYLTIAVTVSHAFGSHF